MTTRLITVPLCNMDISRSILLVWDLPGVGKGEFPLPNTLANAPPGCTGKGLVGEKARELVVAIRLLSMLPVSPTRVDGAAIPG